MTVSKNKELLFIVFVAAVLIIGGVFYSIKSGKKESPQQTADKTMEFINKNLLSEGAAASFTSITEESGIYKIRINVGGQEYDSYVTKDGKYLFPTGYDTTVNPNAGQNASNANPPAATCDSLTKAEKPVLEAFVVSGCPYGLQMQRVLFEIVKNIPSLAANIKVEYIGSIEGNKIISMHGDAEAQENLKQICLRQEQADKYWDYIGCYIKAGDSAGCLTTSGVNKTKLNTCTTDATKGIEYAKADFAKANQYGVSGSPTLFLNGEKVSEFDFGGRTADAVKTLLCCGATQAPGVCSQILATSSAAASFSETYAGSGSSNNAANCGQ